MNNLPEMGSEGKFIRDADDMPLDCFMLLDA